MWRKESDKNVPEYLSVLKNFFNLLSTRFWNIVSCKFKEQKTALTGNSTCDFNRNTMPCHTIPIQIGALNWLNWYDYFENDLWKYWGKYLVLCSIKRENTQFIFKLHLNSDTTIVGTQCMYINWWNRANAFSIAVVDVGFNKRGKKF